MSHFDGFDPQADREKSEAKARLEGKRIQELFKEVFDTDEAREALGILNNYFQADTPSAPASGFNPHQAFYMDGHKAVFKAIDDIKKGKYNE